MENKFYLKIKGIDGSVKVKGFEKTFELGHFSEGGINVSFSPSGNANNGQAYRGTPHIGAAEVVIKNIPGSVSSALLKRTLDATHLEEVTVYEVAKINGVETDIYHVTYTKAHIQYYRNLNGDTALQIGAFATMETSHTDIDDTGKRKPFVVKYDLQASVTS